MHHGPTCFFLLAMHSVRVKIGLALGLGLTAESSFRSSPKRKKQTSCRHPRRKKPNDVASGNRVRSMITMCGALWRSRVVRLSQCGIMRSVHGVRSGIGDQSSPALPELFKLCGLPRLHRELWSCVGLHALFSSCSTNDPLKP